jgi:hypothetical protein
LAKYYKSSADLVGSISDCKKETRKRKLEEVSRPRTWRQSKAGSNTKYFSTGDGPGTRPHQTPNRPKLQVPLRVHVRQHERSLTAELLTVVQRRDNTLDKKHPAAKQFPQTDPGVDEATLEKDPAIQAQRRQARGG